MDDLRRTGTSPSLSGLGIVLLLVAATIGELAPFIPLNGAQEAFQNLLAGLSLSANSVDGGELFERGITFLPLGLLLCWRQAARNRPRRILRASVATGLIATVLEIAQAWTPARHPKLSDLLVGLAAGVVGAWLGHLIANRFMRPRSTAEPLRRHHIALVLLIAWELVLIAGIVLCHRGVHLSGWNSNYPLILANEETGDRPWHGQLRGVAIYGRALDPIEVARASALPVTNANARIRERWGAACLHTFDDRTEHRTPQRIASKPVIDLVLPPSGPATWVWDGSGIEVTGPTAIRSETNVASLSQFLERSGALTIEVEIVVPQEAQHGPARLVTISATPFERNLTLGQAGHDLDFRVRMPRTGANGSWVMCRTRNGRLAPGHHHVAATFRDGTARMYVDGVQAGPPLHLYRPSTLLFRCDFRFASILAALLLMGPAGWLAAVAVGEARRIRNKLLLGCAAAVPPAAVSYGMAALTHREQDTSFLVFAVIAGAMGAAVAVQSTRGTRVGANAKLSKRAQ